MHRTNLKVVIILLFLIVSFLFGILIISTAKPSGDKSAIVPGTSDSTSTPQTTESEVPKDTEATESVPADMHTSKAYIWNSDEEYDLVVRTIIAEARGESVIGQMAIAQCIRDAAEYYDITPTQVLNKLHYAKPYKMSDTTLDQQYYKVAKQAADSVFDDGARAIYSRIIFFYAPAYGVSEFHESQTYVSTIGNHKFFDIKED